MRVMGLLKADEEAEAGTPPTPEFLERMSQFLDDVVKAGVLVSTAGLQPSAKGIRVRLVDDQITVTDGPFAETKELVASYAILEVKSMVEAVKWTTRFLRVLGGGECELRPLFEELDFDSGGAGST